MKDLYKKGIVFLTTLSISLGSFNGNLLHASAGSVFKNLNKELHTSNGEKMWRMLSTAEVEWDRCVRAQCRRARIEFEKPFEEKCKFIYQHTSNDSLARLKALLDAAKRLQDEIDRCPGIIADDRVKETAKELPALIQKMRYELQHPFASKDVQRVFDYVMSFKTIGEQLDALGQFGLCAQKAFYWKLCLLPEQQDREYDYERLQALQDALDEQIITQLKRDKKIVPLFRVPRELRSNIIKLLNQDDLMALLDDYKKELGHMSDRVGFDVGACHFNKLCEFIYRFARDYFPYYRLFFEGDRDDNRPEYTQLAYFVNKSVVVQIFGNLNLVNKRRCRDLWKMILCSSDGDEVMEQFLSLGQRDKGEVFPDIMDAVDATDLDFGSEEDLYIIFLSLNQDDKGRFFPRWAQVVEKWCGNAGYAIILAMYTSMNGDNQSKNFSHLPQRCFDICKKKENSDSDSD